MEDDQASVALTASAARLIRRNGKLTSTMLSFTPTAGPGDTVAAAARAVEAANATVDAAAMAGGAVVSGVDGPTVMVSWDGATTTAVQPWLEEVAVTLSRAGYTGTIHPAPVRRLDLTTWFEPPYRTTPTLLAGYRVLDYPPYGAPTKGRFGATPGNAFRRSAASLAAWGAELPDARRSVTVSSWEGPNRLTDDDLTGWLTSAAALANSSISLCYYHPKQRRARQLGLAQQGQLVVQETDVDRPWQEMVDQARRQLLVDPAALDVAQVRNAYFGSILNWDSLHDGYSPGHEAPDRCLFLEARHLWSERVYDAAAIQVLTGAHLSHGTTLDRWIVTQVADDRYLVEAADLTPWFTQDALDPDVLAQARHDFGDMILTDDHAYATPGPYTRQRPQTPTDD